MLAGEGGRRRVLRRRTRPDGAGARVAELGQRTGDRGRQRAGHLDRFEGLTDVGHSPSGSPTGRPGLRCTRRSKRSSIPAAFAKICPKASVVTQKPAGTRTPSIRPSSPRRAPFPPTTATCVRSISRKSSTSPLINPSLPVGDRRSPDFVAARWPPSEPRPALSADQWSLRQAPHLHVRWVLAGDGAALRRGVAPECPRVVAGVQSARGRGASRGKSRAPRCTAKSMASAGDILGSEAGRVGEAVVVATMLVEPMAHVVAEGARARAGCSPAPPGRGAPGGARRRARSPAAAGSRG